MNLEIIHEIRTLHAKGYSIAQIAEMTGMSEFSVVRIVYPNR